MLIDMSKSVVALIMLGFSSLALLAQAPAPAEKKGGGLLNLKDLLPKPEVAEEKKVDESLLTPVERFPLIKARAEAGNGQAQYELGLLYLQEAEKPVSLDYFEAYNWLLKATMKNHQMAQFYLGRLYENGTGADQSLESALRWRRSAALLGCRQSQVWMGQLHIELFAGNPKYAKLIKQEPANLVEAYAWYDLAAAAPIPARLDPKTPGPEEAARGGFALNLRDYNFERRIPVSAARERDLIARRPEFGKPLYDAAKARCVRLAKEAEEYRAQNRPK